MASLKSWPDHAKAHLGLAPAHFAQGRPAEAIAAARRAIELNPALDEAYTFLALAYSTQGDSVSADAMLAQVREIAPDQAESVRKRAQGLLKASLPPTTSSEYLKTTGSSFLYQPGELPNRASHNAFVVVRKPLPPTAYLEARFESPVQGEREIIVGKRVPEQSQIIHFDTPPTGGWKCKAYSVTVHVFEDESKQTLLGTHRQLTLSQVDIDKVTDPAHVLSRYCP